MSAWIIGVLAFLVGSVALASGGSSSGPWTPPDRAGLDRLRFLCTSIDVPEPWIQYLAFVSYGESGWNNLVGLGDPSLFPPGTQPNLKASAGKQANEAKAARIAFTRNVARFDGCGWPAKQYQFGSGGWFGILPGNGLGNLSGTALGCLPPSSVFDPAASIVMALVMARRLQGREGFGRAPTWLNLRVGWGDPSSMGEPALLASKRKHYEEHREAVGLPPGWLDERVPELPEFDPVAMYEALRASQGVS